MQHGAEENGRFGIHCPHLRRMDAMGQDPSTIRSHALPACLSAALQAFPPSYTASPPAMAIVSGFTSADYLVQH